MNTKSLKRSCTLGAIFVLLAGTELHFFYEQSGGHVLSILFGAVNESTWEHIKVFLAPYVVWSILELAHLRPNFKAFVVGKVVGLYIFPLGIITLFYSYTALTGDNLLFADILISIIVCFTAQFVSFRIYMLDAKAAKWFTPAIAALILMAVMYFSFTAVPPMAELFRDPTTGKYGIPDSGYSPVPIENAELI